MNFVESLRATKLVEARRDSNESRQILSQIPEIKPDNPVITIQPNFQNQGNQTPLCLNPSIRFPKKTNQYLNQRPNPDHISKHFPSLQIPS